MPAIHLPASLAQILPDTVLRRLAHAGMLGTITRFFNSVLSTQTCHTQHFVLHEAPCCLCGLVYTLQSSRFKQASTAAYGTATTNAMCLDLVHTLLADEHVT